MAGLVLEQPVAVGVPEAERGELRARGAGSGRVAGQVRDVPGLVPLGDPPVRRHGGAEIDRADHRVAIDRVREAPAELERLQPRAPRIVRLGGRVQVDPEHRRIEADAGVGEIDFTLVREAFQRGIVFRPDVAEHQVGRAALEAQDLRVHVGDDLERHAVQVRKGPAGLIAPPVARISGEHQRPARPIRLQDERPEHRHRASRSGEPPGLLERAGLERGLERVAREDRQAVQDSQPGPERRRKPDADGRRVRRRDVETPAVQRHRGPDGAVRGGRVDRLECEQHVGGRERRAVRERRPLPERQRVRQPVLFGGPLLGEPRLESMVARFTRIRRSCITCASISSTLSADRR